MGEELLSRTYRHRTIDLRRVRVEDLMGGDYEDVMPYSLGNVYQPTSETQENIPPNYTASNPKDGNLYATWFSCVNA
jgi:hypothetical protein